MQSIFKDIETITPLLKTYFTKPELEQFKQSNLGSLHKDYPDFAQFIIKVLLKDDSYVYRNICQKGISNKDDIAFIIMSAFFCFVKDL